MRPDIALRRVGDDEPFATAVMMADSFVGRLRGLMGRPSLRAGAGLCMPGTNSIHMLFMRFPIDCIFLGEETDEGVREIVAIRRRLPPWRGVVWYVRGAKAVVELAAGSCEGARLEVGDKVRFEAPPRQA